MVSTVQTGGLALVCLIIISLAVGKFLTKSLPNANRYFPKWVALWLTISTIICFWDALFVFNRESKLASFNNTIWYPYKSYVKVDKLYGDVKNDFVWSQSVLNLLEVALNLQALNLLSSKKIKLASVFALIVCAMTCSKTILYHVMEISCGGCNTKQNDWQTFIILYVFPNGVWIWVPMYACFVLGKALSSDGTSEMEDSEEEEEEDQVRGKCSVCHNDVHVSEHRGKDHQGHYYHEKCFEEMMDKGSLIASDDEEEVVTKKKSTSRSSRGKTKGRSKSIKKKVTPKKKPLPPKKDPKYIRTTTLVENLRHPEDDQDVSLTLRPRHRTTRSSSRRSTRNRN
jgi:hypothetical protein